MHISKSGDTRHFLGGPSTHRGTKCPECGRRYSMVWDLDLGDPGLPSDFAAQFPSLTRLPLYICWTCVAATYRVTSDVMIRTSEYRHIEVLKADESPYHEASNETEQVPFSLHLVPTCVEALRCQLQCHDQEATRILEKFYQTTGTGNFSNLGAFLVPPWGHRPKVCPNTKCPASRFQAPNHDLYYEYMMKELALVDGDGNSHLSEGGLWLNYHVCCICSTIVAEHGCS